MPVHRVTPSLERVNVELANCTVWFRATAPERTHPEFAELFGQTSPIVTGKKYIALFIRVKRNSDSVFRLTCELLVPPYGKNLSSRWKSCQNRANFARFWGDCLGAKT